MGCCLIALALAGAPRIAFVLWWIVQPARIQLAFGGNWLWPVFGVLLLPWLSLAYVTVAPGGVNGLDWLLLAVALVLDIGAWGSGGRARSRRD
ncbi:MAG: hypothetical protein HY876_00700 [Coriobacteriales bacterium]|nr:hypothetical protein [Coriobacteriales bacterium]